ncbi:hypothetical protein [Pectinatus frisingensis]|uniref:hypothetical protein n=1 Tax=Pectinatus frisingensis TaxID=865 RepID=UPI0018C76F66|nr:hypothetical protein [Pectinatus frisingensis]
MKKNLKQVVHVFERNDSGLKTVVDIIDKKHDPEFASESIDNEPIAVSAGETATFIASQPISVSRPLPITTFSAKQLLSFANEPHGSPINLQPQLDFNNRKAAKYIAPYNTVLSQNSIGVRQELCNFSVLPQQKIFLNNTDDGIYKWMESIVKVQKPNGVSKMVTVKNCDIKNLSKIIMDADPTAYIEDIREFDKYVVTQFETFDTQMAQIKISTIPGWVRVNDTRYMVYNSAKYSAVHVSRKLLNLPDNTDFQGIIDEGNSFLDIGHGEKEILALFTVAHIGFLFPFLEKNGLTPTFILCLVGQSNSLKTSVVKEVFNLFVPKCEQLFSFRSTSKGLELSATGCRHETFVVDDVAPAVSFGSKKNLEKALENVETLSRIYSDESAQVKSNPAWGINKNFAPKGFCVITAESGLLQGAFSTRSRQMWIKCNRKTFDGETLRKFQENPQIMQRYFSLFVNFLEKNQIELLAQLPIWKERAETYLRQNDFWGIKTGRIKRAFLVMLTVTLVIDWFDRSIRGTSPQSLMQSFNFYKAFREIFITSELATQDKDPVRLFMDTLRESVKNGDFDIAENRCDFKNGINTCIGFYEADRELLYLKPREIYKKINEFCNENGENMPLAKNELFNQLKEENITLTDSDSSLRKLSFQIGGKRQRMLCIKNIYEILGEDKND